MFFLSKNETSIVIENNIQFDRRRLISIIYFLRSQRHAKIRDEDNFQIFTSYDQLCSGDEGSVSENVTEIPVHLGSAT